ncbi:hypothetical protein [Bradyrhizobium archetypum]|uniref:Uncharacterized protein n=1 Tax=Bradyrhizobium archetypum TaxID=2721160 RepID=A0A7Y4HBC0_9BRAD|nr:hypothetical protein [Bradyrhizobium archetypum]NOJ50172.1 hypothetical protein [Bradyrhizobium archetypum]
MKQLYRFLGFVSFSTPQSESSETKRKAGELIVDFIHWMNEPSYDGDHGVGIAAALGSLPRLLGARRWGAPSASNNGTIRLRAIDMRLSLLARVLNVGPYPEQLNGRRGDTLQDRVKDR